MRSSVVLPQPDGPTMHTNCPRGMLKLMLSSEVTRCSPAAKILVRPAISILSRSDLPEFLDGAIRKRRVDELGGFDAALDQPVFHQPVDLFLEVAGVHRAVAAEGRELHLVVQRRIFD